MTNNYQDDVFSNRRRALTQEQSDASRTMPSGHDIPPSSMPAQAFELLSMSYVVCGEITEERRSSLGKAGSSVCTPSAQRREHTFHRLSMLYDPRGEGVVMVSLAYNARLRQVKYDQRYPPSSIAITSGLHCCANMHDMETGRGSCTEAANVWLQSPCGIVF